MKTLERNVEDMMKLGKKYMNEIKLFLLQKVNILEKIDNELNDLPEKSVIIINTNFEVEKEICTKNDTNEVKISFWQVRKGYRYKETKKLGKKMKFVDI
jgi:hypothetical protein